MVPPTPKRMMWRLAKASWRMLQRSLCCSFACGVQLVLRSGVLTVLDLDKVDVTPRFAEVFKSVLSGNGGSAGGWRCCWGAPSLPQLPPATPKNPPTLVCCFCVFAALGVTSTKSGRLELNLSLSGKRGGKSHLLGTILLSAVSEIWRLCMSIRSLLPISLKTHILRHINRQLFSRTPWCFLFALLQNKRSLSLYTFLFYIHQLHVSSSFCVFCLARCSFRLFPNFRWDAFWGIYSDGTLPYLPYLT